jgi:putative copper export protein
VVTVSWETLRISLHVLAATIWVGGQITVGALVPTLRGVSDEAPRLVARGFNRVAWPAYAVLGVKMVVVLASGVAAWLHIRATTRSGMAVWGAVSALTALAALVLGVVLRG